MDTQLIKAKLFFQILKSKIINERTQKTIRNLCKLRWTALPFALTIKLLFVDFQRNVNYVQI